MQAADNSQQPETNIRDERKAKLLEAHAICADAGSQLKHPNLNLELRLVIKISSQLYKLIQKIGTILSKSSIINIYDHVK